jgi:hypothetical protein
MLLRLSLACLVAFSLTCAARAQTSLAGLVEGANYNWVFGEWKASTDTGDSITLKISWDLNRKMVLLHVVAPDMESKGYTALLPGSENPTYFGVDNRGAVSRGNWDQDGGDLVLRLDIARPNDSPLKSAVVFSGSPSSGLEVRMHGLESWGGLRYPAEWRLRFKKS